MIYEARGQSHLKRPFCFSASVGSTCVWDEQPVLDVGTQEHEAVRQHEEERNHLHNTIFCLLTHTTKKIDCLQGSGNKTAHSATHTFCLGVFS